MRMMLDFKAPNNVPSKCEYEIIDTPLGKIVFLIQSDQNEGMSVTNAVEVIASILRTEHALPVNTIFVEHYPHFSLERIANGKTYDIVEFAEYSRDVYRRPRWVHIKRDTIFWNLLNDLLYAGVLNE